MIVIPPALVERQLVHYVAQQRAVTMGGMDDAIGEALGAVETWLASAYVTPVGPPIVRYRVIDMARELLIEVGLPVASPIAVPEGLVADSLPAGAYGSATYRNMDEGVAGNAVLIEWAAANGIQWDVRETDAGDVFVSRVEVLLGDPDVDPDPKNWECEVAILVATRPAGSTA